MEVRLIVANQNRIQIHAIVYKQKPLLYGRDNGLDPRQETLIPMVLNLLKVDPLSC